MTSLIHPAKLVAAFLVVLTPLSVHAENYYVAPNGSDTAAGTEAAPFATVGRGQMAASAGDTVFIRAGTYTIASTSATVGVAFTKSGSSGAPIRYFAYPGETPIFDCSACFPERVTGFDVRCNWIHIRGIEIRGTQQIITGDSWGVRIQGSNNIIENMNVHHGEAPGFFITSGSGNLILNCDSHDNYDPLEGGGNGDGFGCHSSGAGNVIRGCRGYRNSDDGYDFINAAGSCTVEQSWAWGNGYQYTNGSPVSAGNGAGFKAGGYGSPPSTPAGGAAVHTVRQCVAFGNKAQGFYANHHPGRINFHNNTSFNNPANFNMLADSGYPSDHVIRNNVAMTTGSTISKPDRWHGHFQFVEPDRDRQCFRFRQPRGNGGGGGAPGRRQLAHRLRAAGRGQRSHRQRHGRRSALRRVGARSGRVRVRRDDPGQWRRDGQRRRGWTSRNGGAGGRPEPAARVARAATGGGSATGGTAGGAGRAGTGGTGGSTTAGTGGATSRARVVAPSRGPGEARPRVPAEPLSGGAGGAGTGGTVGAGTGGAIATGGSAGGRGASGDAGACACGAAGGGGSVRLLRLLWLRVVCAACDGRPVAAAQQQSQQLATVAMPFHRPLPAFASSISVKRYLCHADHSGHRRPRSD